MPLQFEMIHLATTIEEVREAVDRAKDILEGCGMNVDVTADQLWDWFETNLPVADDEELGDSEMCTAIEKWCVDKTVSEVNKVEYRKLLSEAKSCLAGLAR